MNIILLSRLITLWIICCSILLSFIVDKNDKFYKFGPNKDLSFIGITIDTSLKYFYICIYCFINTIIRSTNHNIIQPWITLKIQDSTNKTIVKHAHEIVSLNIIYTWFDWFIYINLLLTQIDMILIEILSEFIITNIITRKYIIDKEYF